jgi:Domain of unknown function (DUF3291)
MPLAQLNIGRLIADKTDLSVAGFMDNLALVNAIAERAPGFLWRLKDESNDNATDLPVTDDPRVIVNLSLWESVQTLEAFVWTTLHEKFLRKRGDWFAPWEGPHLVSWWWQEAEMPTLAQGLERLAQLAAHGPTDEAFGWQQLSEARLWQQRR